MQQTDLIECGVGALGDFLMAGAGDHQRQRDIVKHCPIVQQAVVLEHEADVATEKWYTPATHAVEILVIDDDLTARMAFNERNESQQRTLASAGATGDEGHRACLDMQVDLLQGLDAAGILFRDVAEANHSVTGQEGVNKCFRSERPQVLQPFTDADITNRQAQLLGQGKDNTATGGTVELG